ncbi:SWIM zinc finger family protein [Rhodobacter maris]|uniref:SWIM zinc finger family protein n=1 Tax=Rhodobacter maris TaxID=446682 RepID=UPI001596B64C|nr:SWIM zinc finger family protein [Rhodobacter maris]
MTYSLDLAAQTCTCPDFVEVRGNLAKSGELGRLCKHLVRALNERHAFDSANNWVRAIVNAGHGAPYIAWEVSLPTAKPMLVTVGNSREWLNVFAHMKRNGERYSEASGPIEQFGWSLGGHRWSYGQGPAGASEIRPFLKQLDGVDFDALLRGDNRSRPPQSATTFVVGTAPSFPVPTAKTAVSSAAPSARPQTPGKPRSALGRLIGLLHR